MSGLTRMRTLGDVRTALSIHARSTPRHRSTTYLEVLSLGMENLRLQSELTALAKRRQRIEGRLLRVRETLVKRAGTVQQEVSSGDPGGAPLSEVKGHRPGKQLVIDY
ncbi:MAG: hypothetical protein HYX99_01865 [Chloroflexi bacterium]|nr:hypothetical protein [Chloroflexota bacterium]